jgi:hypothetical protein
MPQAEQIPAGHVERRLHVGVALHALVHQPTDDADLARIAADEIRRELGQPCAYARRVSRQVGGPERADLAMPDQTRIGLDLCARWFRGGRRIR